MNQEYWYELPQADAFADLYRTTGWQAHIELGREKLYTAIQNSWRVVSAYKDGRLVGFGRIVSDGTMQALICDVIVDPAFRRRGIGTTIVRMLLAEAGAAGIPSIQLCCAQGKAEFYRRLGFVERAADAPGMVWKANAKGWKQTAV